MRLPVRLSKNQHALLIFSEQTEAYIAIPKPFSSKARNMHNSIQGIGNIFNSGILHFLYCWKSLLGGCLDVLELSMLESLKIICFLVSLLLKHRPFLYFHPPLASHLLFLFLSLEIGLHFSGSPASVTVHQNLTQKSHPE